MTSSARSRAKRRPRSRPWLCTTRSRRWTRLARSSPPGASPSAIHRVSPASRARAPPRRLRARHVRRGRHAGTRTGRARRGGPTRDARFAGAESCRTTASSPSTQIRRDVRRGDALTRRRFTSTTPESSSTRRRGGRVVSRIRTCTRGRRREIFAKARDGRRGRRRTATRWRWDENSRTPSSRVTRGARRRRARRRSWARARSARRFREARGSRERRRRRRERSATRSRRRRGGRAVTSVAGGRFCRPDVDRSDTIVAFSYLGANAVGPRRFARLVGLPASLRRTGRVSETTPRRTRTPRGSLLTRLDAPHLAAVYHDGFAATHAALMRTLRRGADAADFAHPLGHDTVAEVAQETALDFLAERELLGGDVRPAGQGGGVGGGADARTMARA